MTTLPACFASAAAGAPAALAARSRVYLPGTSESTHPSRLAQASRLALVASMQGGSRRDQALDLLAADALLTMALLVTASEQPAALLQVATGLRHEAMATG
ncbi:MAG TPA: hypothetical protein VFN22_04470 [Gemmatimonadales bacterium]|nr:hypothetical protein [Gemmatimonadales bacterium]